jgi:hypothetical protein
METNGYGQIRQDIGELKILLKNTETVARDHIEDDEKKFSHIDTRLSWLEKMMWLALGGVGVIGLSGIAEIFKSLVLR